MTNLTILSKQIRTNDNLFSLNDLHKASGNDPKHQPAFFMRNVQTRDLIAEIERENANSANSQSLVTKKIEGRLGGTYACEELALAYATWISPKFHLVVLRAFIAMHKGEQLQNSAMISPVEPQPDEEALNLIVRLYHFCAEAQEMREKICKYDNRHIISSIEKDVGGHYLHNLGFPLKNVLDDTKQYIHEKSERIMFIKGMLSLLDEPKRLKA